MNKPNEALPESLRLGIERLAAVIRQAYEEKRWGEIRPTLRNGEPHMLQTEFTERLRE